MPDYKVKEVAEILRCNKAKIYNMIKDGILRSYSIGKCGTRIRREEVERIRGCLQ